MPLEVGTGPCVNTLFEDDPWAPAYVAGRALGLAWKRAEDLGGPARLRAVRSAEGLCAYLREVGPKAGLLLGDLMALVDEESWEGVKARMLVVGLHALRVLP